MKSKVLDVAMAFLGVVMLGVLVGGLVWLQVDLSASNKENTRLSQKLVIADAAMASQQLEITALQQEIQAKDTALGASKAEVANLQVQGIADKKTISGLKEDFSAKNQVLAQNDVTIADLQKENQSLSDKLDNLVEDYNIRNQQLGETQDRLEATQVDLKLTSYFETSKGYIVDKLLSAISTFMPREGGTMVVRKPNFGDSFFTYRGGDRGFDIKLHYPWISNMSANQADNTIYWGWGVFPGGQAEILPTPTPSQ